MCRFFDRTGCGYIKVDDLRRLLHSLGLGLTHRTVKELVGAALDASARASAAASSGRSGGAAADRIYYRDLTDKEVPLPPAAAAAAKEKEEGKDKVKAEEGPSKADAAKA